MNQATAVLIPLMACLMTNIILSDRCCQINSRQLPQYKLVGSSSRSNQLILSRRTVRNLDECKAFALAKKALAFNYGLETDPSGKMEIWRCYNLLNIYVCRCHEDFLVLNMLEWSPNGRSRNAETTRKMCQALQCPEIHNFTTLVRDRNYKYYSMYPRYFATGKAEDTCVKTMDDGYDLDEGRWLREGSNFTLACIPRAGVFIFSSNNLNYSQAQISCQKLNASLAHIISEERTNGLAKYIWQNTPTFVGLSNRGHENIWKNEFDEPLSCFKYRSWGEGQPSHSKGCVSLVQPFKSKPGPFWTVVPCNSELPFICEVSPIYKSISKMLVSL